MTGDDFDRIVDAPARPKVRGLRLAGGNRAGTAATPPPVDPPEPDKANGISPTADDRPSLLVRSGDLPKLAGYPD